MQKRKLDRHDPGLLLTQDDLRAIDEAASRIRVEGARYPEELERRTGLQPLVLATGGSR